jgi:DNA-binding transcriptional ArsR family regulator
MAKENFVLVSLNENKAKELAQVMSNESCRKILDYLAEKEATETDLAKRLELPLSTVHYNLKHLVEAGLVTAEEFHYSEKGKEVNHYKLANKYVIIAPKSTFGLKEKLKSVLPIALGAVLISGLIHIFFGRTGTFGAAKVREATFEAAEAQAISQTQPNVALWFLAGALIVLVLYLIVDYIRNKK